MNKAIVVIAISLLVQGCATYGQQKREFYNHLESRIGQDINEVISEIGPPSGTFQKPNGETIYSFAYNGGSGSVYRANLGAIRQTNYSKWCQVDYTVAANNSIADYLARGNNCF